MGGYKIRSRLPIFRDGRMRKVAFEDIGGGAVREREFWRIGGWGYESRSILKIRGGAWKLGAFGDLGEWLGE